MSLSNAEDQRGNDYDDPYNLWDSSIGEHAEKLSNREECKQSR